MPPKTPMPKKQKQPETDEGGNTQPPSKEHLPIVISLFHEIINAKKKEDEQSWDRVLHGFETPRASPHAQGPGPSLAMESPLIITPNIVRGEILPVPTSPAQSFGPVPIFPFQPTKEPGPPMKGAPQKKASQSAPPLKALKPPPGLEHVIEGKKEEAFRWQ